MHEMRKKVKNHQKNINVHSEIGSPVTIANPRRLTNMISQAINQKTIAKTFKQ